MQGIRHLGVWEVSLIGQHGELHGNEYLAQVGDGRLMLPHILNTEIWVFP